MAALSTKPDKMIELFTHESLIMTSDAIIHGEYETPEIFKKWQDNLMSKEGHKHMGDIYKLDPAAVQSYAENRLMVNELNENLHKKMVDDENKPPEQNPEDEQGENSQTTANRLTNVYSEEDRSDALAEKLLAIKKGKTAKSDTQNFFADSNILVTGGTGFLGKASKEPAPGRPDLRASRVVEKIVL